MPEESDYTHELIQQGERLTDIEAADLEIHLRASPDDLDARTKLLGYYFLKPGRGRIRARAPHVRWVIENHPEAEMAGLPYCEMDPTDGDVYFHTKQLWRRQCRKHKDNPRVLANAANYNIIHDKDLAERLLKQVQALEPDNPEWRDRLGHLYALHRPDDEEDRQKTKARALSELEAAVALSQTETERFHRWINLPAFAFEADDTAKAADYVRQLLEMVSRWDEDRLAAIARYEATIALGRIALRSGQVDKAQDYLLSAADIAGAPPAYPWDQSIKLAKELLEEGRGEVVIQFLQKSNAGAMEDRRTRNRWIRDIEATGTADFDF